MSTSRPGKRGDLLTAPETGEILGVTSRRVCQLVAEGRLVATIETPWGRLFARPDIERLAAERAIRMKAS